MKKAIIFFLLTINIFLLNSIEMDKVEMILVKSFSSGNQNGELGNFDNIAIDSPTAIMFDNDGNLYVCDIINQRLVKYDKEFNFLTNYYNCYSISSIQMFFNEEREIISYSNKSICIDNKNFEKKVLIRLGKSKYKKLIDHRPSFIVINDTIYIKLKNNSIISIDNPNTNYKNNLDKIDDEKKSLEKVTKSTNSSFKINNDKNFILNDNIVTNNLIEYNDYYVKKRNSENKTNDTTQRKHVNGFTDELISTLSDAILFGRDKDYNHYWVIQNTIIIITDIEGYVINAIEYDPNKNSVIPALHPNGDIYFFVYDGKTNNLYKVKKNW